MNRKRGLNVLHIVVAVAEQLQCRRIFTVDKRAFGFYRPKVLKSFETLP